MRARGAKTPTLGQINKWFAAYWAAVDDDGEPWDDAPAFSELRETFGRFAAAVGRLNQAMQDPFTPENAAVIALGDNAWNKLKIDRCDFEDHQPTIIGVGRAIQWALAGATPEGLVQARRDYRAYGSGLRACDEEVKDVPAVVANRTVKRGKAKK
jgi:hypothetical protein